MPIVKVDMGEIYYECEGEGNPIVFIHPAGMGLKTFHFQKKLLQEHMKVITFDLRGNGRSFNWGEDASVQKLAKDIHTLLAELEIDSAIICGYSNGGLPAQEFSLQYPEMVRGLILIGGFADSTTPFFKSFFSGGLGLIKTGAYPVIAEGLGAAHYKVRKELSEYMKLSDPITVKMMYGEMKNYSCADRLDEFSMPLLLIYGSADLHILGHHKPYLQFVKDLKIAEISPAAHQIPVTAYHEVNAIILQFMRSLQEDSFM
ncbi:alpha/beta fold hydrolase [Bacillus lacus]|uniref:Alpha/beta fold hydrolase n=1 Tax=Metabacillus lacus TaxID=1983721 RepID=A0A7X2IYS3_9BACI|nr:alpha/beta hydrolase [Metabacillus lacus]MRX71623.1 alpha/beta fold hydrolase [Metabacillus lacus]